MGKYDIICVHMEMLDCIEENITPLAGALKSGAVAVVPTDTVYGLAAHPACPQAVERLYAIKGRDGGKPIALLASGPDAVARFGFPLTGRAARLAEQHWPGSLTLVVENRSGATEGFRVPDHAWLRRLLEECGGVLRVTSANLSGLSPATDGKSALESVGLDADYVVDGGPCKTGVASTVAKVSPAGEVTLLRQGAIRL